MCGVWLEDKKKGNVSHCRVGKMTPGTETRGHVGSVPVQLAIEGGVGSVPAALGDQVPVGAAHPQLADGHLVGHGGAALRVFVGLTQMQNDRLEHMGQVECPRGRRGQFYWPLKSNAVASLESAAGLSEVGSVDDIVLRPVSVTFVGLRDLISCGRLYAADGAQWRLYAPLSIPSPRDEAGNVYYEIHGAYTL